MRLRCIFGLSHGKWIEPREAEDGTFQRTAGPLGSDYVPYEIAGRTILIADGHDFEDALDWLFKYQPDHPQHPDDDNHPREQAKRLS